MNKYTAKNIKLLEGIEHVRLRPAMYIGDTDFRGLHHLIYEIIDNAIDETLAGFCNKIHVILEENNYVTISDNGRGIPIDFHNKEMMSALELVMTKIGAGGKFDKNSYKVSGGLHGVGLSCVNALSEKLIAKIYRNNKIYQQIYAKGIALSPVKEIGTTNITGTTITFKPDQNIFKNIDYDYKYISSRLRELSYLNKGIKIYLLDHRNKNIQKKDLFYSKIGINEFITFLDGNTESINSKIININHEDNNISLEISMRYNKSYREKIFTYVNNIYTKEGGTHLTGYRRSLTRVLKKYAKEYGFLSKNKIEITKEDIKEGLTAVISIKLNNPEFEGQTKTKLGDNRIIGLVEKIVYNKLEYFLLENPDEAKKIINKIIISAKSRYAAKKAKELIQNKTSIIHNSLPGKLADCSSNDPKTCEIYLVEGDSAGGTAKQGRNRQFQAILPLRGKILNVEKAINYKIFENEEIKNIFTALGVYLDVNNIDNLNINNLKYHKIIIMTDADIDGSHISTLILTFFFRYMKKLIEEGFIYIATPPLFLIKTKTQKLYAWSKKESKKILEKIKTSNKSFDVQRYKGLGEMNADQLWETTMNPQNRTLRKIYIKDIYTANNIFSMLMGENVQPRKKFIEQNAIYANIDV
jgi:DNA gyrase subunit B